MRKIYSFNRFAPLSLKSAIEPPVMKAKRSLIANGVTVILLSAMLLISGKSNAQCANYQVYESFPNALPTAGGTWTKSPLVGYNTTLPRTGAYHLTFTAVNYFIRTPQIANPGVFSFWYAKANDAVAHSFNIQTSPDGTTWTTQGSTTTPAAVLTYQQYSIDLGALGLTNVYVRIIDARASGAQQRYVDDVSWTTTGTNTLIPTLANCSQTISCGTTYTFTDQGGGTGSDTYNANTDYTITFTPSIGTSKIQMAFSAFNTESGQDGMVIYDGPTTASPIISSGLGVGANAVNCPAGSYYGTTSPGTITSTDASGCITIRFRSNATTAIANLGWIASVSCFSIAPCATPTAQPTALTFGAIDPNNIAGSFTASSPASNKYLVLVSTSATPPSPGPVNGTTYVAGNNIDGATVVQVGATTSFTATGLTPATTYYFYVYSLNDVTCTGGPAYLTTTPLTNSAPTPALAANDLCSGAINLTSNIACSTTTGSTVGATDNDEAGDCTAGSQKLVWYKFVAVGTTETVTVQPIAGFNAVIGALSACGNTTVPTGGACTNASGDGGVETLPMTGLTIGATYYVQVSEFNGDSTVNGFTICVTHPSPCPTPTAQPTNLVLSGITGSSINGSFTAASPAPQKYLVVYTTSPGAPSPGPANNTVYAVGSSFSGATVVSVTNSTTFTASGLTPSTQYYFYVYSYNDTACGAGPVYQTTNPLTNTATTTNGVSNDICVAALSITSSTTCNNTTGSTLGANDNNETGDCTDGTEKAVWYKFVAVATSHTVTVVGSAGFDAVIGALSTCGSATTPTGGGCTDNTFGGGTETMTLTGLTIGNTYYVQVYDWWGVTIANAFTICVTHTGPCTTPTAQPTNLTFTATTPATISGSFNPSVPSAGRYLVLMSTSATPPSPNPVNGTTYTVGGTVGGATVISISNATTFTATGLTGSTQYYFYVYSYNAVTCTGGPLYFTTSPLSGNNTTLPTPTNYLCSGATTLPCNTSSLFGTTVGATNVAHGTGCTMSNYGVWYTFTGDGNITTIESTATSGWDHEMSIVMGNCGAFTNITCQDSGLTNGTEAYTFTSTVGATYYVYVAHWDSASSTTGSFVISRSCSSPPPPMTNDECLGAIALTVGTSCNYSYFTNATATGSTGVPAPGCGNYLGGDVWFKLVVPANGIIRVNSLGSVLTDGGMALYTGACGSLTLVKCDDSSSPNAGDMPLISQGGLTPGSTVYIRFWEYGNNNNGTFALCATTPDCTAGTGMGTSALGCPTVVSGGLNLDGVDPAPIDACVSSTCTDLEATYLFLGQPTAYTVTPISPYTPPYQFGCLANPVSVNIDDVWSPVVTLPFNFCFYGNNYNQCLIGSNGVLTFDLVNNTPEGTSAWSFNTALPSATLFTNTIFGVYQDIDPSKGGNVGWELITLATGCRALVVSWQEIPMYSVSCNSMLYTGMMVLYENTNIIEVYVQEKTTCSTWNNGNAIIGVQNANATQWAAPPTRNSVATDWTATNEAWRFTPSGTTITSIKWYEGAGTTGPVVGTTQTVNVCPTVTTTYTAEVSYALCTGGTLKTTDQTVVTVSNSKTWNGSVSTDWNTAANWTPVGVPTAADCVVIPVTVSLRYPIISGSGYNGLASTLTVMNNASLTVNSNNSVTVTNWVNVGASGVFTIQNSASLVQVSNTAVNVGNITYNRNATNVKALDYVYWSSPVANFSVNNITAPLSPGPIYTWNPSITNPNGGQGNWQAASGAMTIGKGYIVRAPSTFTSTPGTLSGSFTGVPNNGTINMGISRGTYQGAPYAGTNGTQITNLSDNYNLIGNPYPSAIRGSQFLFNNNTKIEGNIKLWMHGASPAQISSPFYNTFLYNYNVNDYSTWTWTGTVCCPAAASDLFIGAAQGFVVQMLDGPGPATDVVTFDNGLRSATYDNSVFYRMVSLTSTQNPLVDIERNRIWLDIINADGMSDRTLVGYVEGASQGRDNAFDASALVGTTMSIYSLYDTEKLCIQGRSLPFDPEDVVPLAVTIPADGNYKIGIGAVDGLFENAQQPIYVEDKALDIIHDLRSSPYSFDVAAGNYDTRFFLRYNNGTLGVNNADGSENLTAMINNKQLVVQASQNIRKIEVYDVTGKLIRTYLPTEKDRKFSDDFHFASGVYFARIELENSLSYTRKLMNK
jgi:hypothetical protein